MRQTAAERGHLMNSRITGQPEVGTRKNRYFPLADQD
jgi:hypothetical protein